jgi:putative endonuclease
VPTHHQSDIGEYGEELACRELERRGYAILARRYRTRRGEIDIVAKDGDALVFVEVKTRSDTRFGGPLAAITSDKQRRLTRMALDYLSRHGTGGEPCRFDVVSILPGRDGLPRVEVITNAFVSTGG